MDQFENVSIWDGEQLHQIVLNVAEAMDLKLGKVAQPLRVAVCGSGVSPAIDITLSLLGREKTLARIKRAIAYIKNLA
jgi:glutamyl-tRNA synthetase